MTWQFCQVRTLKNYINFSRPCLCSWTKATYFLNKHFSVSTSPDQWKWRHMFQTCTVHTEFINRSHNCWNEVHKKICFADMKKAGTFFVFRDAPAVDNNQADILLNLNHNELKFLHERILQLHKQVRSPTPAGTCSRCIVGKNTRAQSSGRFRPFPSWGR